MGFNIGAISHNAGTIFRGGQGKELLPQVAVEALLSARRGVAPSDEVLQELAKAGAKFDGEVGRDIGSAPKSGSLADELKKRVGEELYTLKAAWKDRNFPKRLEQALDQQRQLLPKLREALVLQNRALGAASDLKTSLTQRVATLERDAAAAVASGDDALAAKLLAQKIGAKNELTNVTERVTKYTADVRGTGERLTDLEQKIGRDADNAQLLIAEWKLGRSLTDLSKEADQALKDLNKLEGDILGNRQRADQATKDAGRSVDDMLGGGIKVPGSAPGTQPSPVDEAVQRELDELKRAAGRA